MILRSGLNSEFSSSRLVATSQGYMTQSVLHVAELMLWFIPFQIVSMNITNEHDCYLNSTLKLHDSTISHIHTHKHTHARTNAHTYLYVSACVCVCGIYFSIFHLFILNETSAIAPKILPSELLMRETSCKRKSRNYCLGLLIVIKLRHVIFILILALY